MAIAFVNSVADNHADGATATLTAFNLTAGNLVVVCVRYGDGGGTTFIDAMRDTAGNVYTRAEGIRVAFTGDIWYCQNASGHASNVIVIDFIGGTGTFISTIAAQYSGLSPLAAHDIRVNASQAAGGGSPTTVTPAFTTLTADQLIINFSSINNTFSSIACSGFTQRNITANNDSRLFDQIVSTVQTGATVTTTSNSLGFGATMFTLVVSFSVQKIRAIVPRIGIANSAAVSATTIATDSFITETSNLIVVGVRWATGGSGATLQSVTDSAGNTYSLIEHLAFGPTDGTMELWYARNVTGHTANIVTAVFSSAVGSRGILVGQWAGVSRTIWNAGADGTSLTTSVTTDPYSTTTAEQLVVNFATAKTGGVVFLTSSGFFGRAHDHFDAELFEQFTETIQTNATATTTSTGGTAMGSIVATFRALIDPLNYEDASPITVPRIAESFTHQIRIGAETVRITMPMPARKAPLVRL